MSGNTETENLRRENERLRSRLQKMEERYTMTLDSISEIYFETDTSGRLTFFNQSLCNITGFSKNVLHGKVARDLCPRESATRLEQIFRHTLEKKESHALSHLEVFHKKGHTIPLEISVSLIQSPGLRLQGFRGVARDISSKIAAEKEKALFEEQLQQAQKLEAIGTLAAGIAHDFNNLLMGIQGNTSLLMLHTEPETPAWKRLIKIEAQVRHGANLTRQLLGFSKDQEGKRTICDINTLVQETGLIFSRTHKNIQMHQELSGNICPVMADSSQISEVLLYIFINAATHGMPDGGDLYVETDRVFLKETFTSPHKLPAGDYLRILIRDTGKGMDEKTRKRAFDPFFSTLEKGQGTGMGLASAFSIIKNHHGIISINSSAGQGCTFIIHLPCSSHQARGIVPASAIKTILLVDDEEMILDVAGDLLKELGHQVICASGGQEALDLFDRHSDTIDLVILDMVMPRMDGKKTIQALRKRNPALPVLISSGYEKMHLEPEDILLPEITAFIQKPFTLKGLKEAIMGFGRIQAQLDTP
ncbi:hybrid sensor histidine kinase/response regulator [Desulfobotulus mexicanus]|uniref:histidine kinase n=1 Tax=Desulfobotulus mexicanus TaxID=2586642 RepID=A0A5S5MFT9_9BACT|nr:PAS domain S-box protein [Desulfobotulus mexicanus]TYT74537.1 PAS domain S-box protein [Desulfobotulus mexicanus]